MLKIFKWSKIKKFLGIVLSLLVIAGVIAGIVKLVQFANRTSDTVISSYSVGSLDSDGTYYKQSDKSKIYTKNYFECLGLKITPDFNATISYEVFLYDENGEFLFNTGSLTGSYTLNTKYARYARIVIKPDNDANILFYEIHKYAKQLTVEVDKDQIYKDPSEINLIPLSLKENNKTLTLDSSTNKIVSANGNGVGFYEIDVREFKKVNVKFNSVSSSRACYFVDNNNLKKGDFSISMGSLELTNGIPTGATKLLIPFGSGEIVSVYETI